MKHPILFCFLLFSIGLPAQSLIDSLYAQVTAMPEDSHKVLTYRLLYRALYQKDKAQEMLDIAEKGLILS